MVSTIGQRPETVEALRKTSAISPMDENSKPGGDGAKDDDQEEKKRKAAGATNAAVRDRLRKDAGGA